MSLWTRLVKPIKPVSSDFLWGSPNRSIPSIVHILALDSEGTIYQAVCELGYLPDIDSILHE